MTPKSKVWSKVTGKVAAEFGDLNPSCRSECSQRMDNSHAVNLSTTSKTPAISAKRYKIIANC